jgi:precorrin-3B synthase
MLTGDGLLVRLRLTGGILSPERATAIAGLADRYGNGLIEVTSRAHLQVRGVSEASLGPLTEELGALDLLDADAETEAVRNVLASPLAGLDAAACLDIRPVVAALENRLAASRLRALPAKFGFVVDDGGQLGLGDIDADIRFEAVSTEEFAVRLGGEALAVGRCNAEDLPEVGVTLAAAFLRLRELGSETAARMRDLVERIGSEAIVSQAPIGGRALLPLVGEGGTRSVTDEGRCRSQADRCPALPLIRPAPPGTFSRKREKGAPLRIGASDTGYVGVGIAFGRLGHAELGRLAEIASRFEAELRLTPWRAILLAGLSPLAVEAAAAALAGSTLILTPDDPRLWITACPGAPACLHATVPTQADAARLAPQLPRHGRLHVSGCCKGCGQTRATPFTLVGREGRYDLVVDGTARDMPITTGLTLDEAQAMLKV